VGRVDRNHPGWGSALREETASIAAGFNVPICNPPSGHT
jgi:hypothetical protein